MEAVLSGLKDIIKYKVIGYINTGDKTLDNLANTFALAIIALVFSTGLKDKILFNYHKLRCKLSEAEITIDNVQLWKKMISNNESKLLVTTWYIGKNQSLTKAIVNYLLTEHSWQFKKLVRTISSSTDGLKYETISFDSISDSMIINEIYPIDVDKKEYVAMKKIDNATVLIHTSQQIFDKFLDLLVEKYGFKKSKANLEKNNESRKLHVFEYNKETPTKHDSHELFSDRTFDKIVSKNKKKIINILNSFKHANAGGVSKFNGLGTYNLGFMFHGPPGTGETSMIKAICNYLSRDALIIDMRTIKTIDELHNISKSVNINLVALVFDEFDCMQDLLQRKVKSVSEECKEIQNEINELFRTKTSIELNYCEDDKPNKKIITDIDNKISYLEKSIKKLESQMSLDTMLTFLDGTIETRNRVIIATTNHIEKIDSTLLRAGRFDINLELGYFNDEEIKELLKLMYENIHHEKIDSHTYPSNKYTPVRILNIAQQEDSIDDVISILTTKTKVSDT